MKNNELTSIHKECPKTFEMYKKYLINKYINKNEQVEIFLTDNILQLNIQSAPMSLTYFFDTLYLVGTLHFDNLTNLFNICVNGESIIDDNENWLGDSDRLKAEKILINYLFTEIEKTL